ncbi:MAG: ATP-binding protein [Steroidobacteraceae bacterium]
MKPTGVLWSIAAVVAVLILAADLLSPLQGAIAVLYIIVVLLVARAGGRRAVIAAGLACGALTLLAFAAGHLGSPLDAAYVRLGVSLVAIAATTLLSIRDQSSRTTLAEQARLLGLSHDTVIIRDTDDVVVFWNEGAEQLYGWLRAEALGRRCNELLHSEFPAPEVERALQSAGQWSGELVRTRRDGSRIVLLSRWLLRRDPHGRGIGVIESSADVTEQLRADARRQQSEQRYATIFNSAGFAIWESDWSATRRYLHGAAPAHEGLRAWLAAHPETIRACVDGAVIGEANDAAVALFGAAHRSQLVGRTAAGFCVPESQAAFAEVLAALAGGAQMVETEVPILRLDQRRVEVVLRLRLLPEDEPWSRVLMMALDVTERNEARARVEQASAQLVHAARISTLAQLAASIAHEVNQPLAAIINYGRSGKRWLVRDEPDVAEVANSLDQIVANGNRAADVISRVRSLARKGVLESAPLSLGQLAEESLELVQREARVAQVTVHFVRTEGLPPVLGDRVQIQQVMVNLLMNAIQAMQEMADARRELRIQLDLHGPAWVRTAIEDTGPGITGDTARIFDPFYTTKPDGMGMGLSICRSIIEAQGGRIEAGNNPGAGATFAFTLPVHRGIAAQVSSAHTSV